MRDCDEGHSRFAVLAGLQLGGRVDVELDDTIVLHDGETLVLGGLCVDVLDSAVCRVSLVVKVEVAVRFRE